MITAQRILANGQTFGRYGRLEIEALCNDALALMAERSAA
jgi:hypothetical protein